MSQIIDIVLQKIERNTLKVVKKAVNRNSFPEKNLPLLDGESLNNLILAALKDDDPFMAARFGSIELTCALYPYLLNLSLIDRYKLYVSGKIDFLHWSDDYARRLVLPLCNNAGFFPGDISLLSKYSSLMVEDVRQLDCCCCCWEREDLFEKEYSDNVRFARLEEMEPYDYAIPWSEALSGKKVLIVHPFSNTIEAQYAKRDSLWDNKAVLPEFELHVIKAVQSIAGEKVPFNNWFEALDSMKQQMDDIDYDIAIIGCGAYGFHLAAHAKRCGKKAVHLGGATQILFGIKGKRWDELPAVSKFYNEHWVYPSAEETPKNKSLVEGGCYW